MLLKRIKTMGIILCLIGIVFIILRKPLIIYRYQISNKGVEKLEKKIDTIHCKATIYNPTVAQTDNTPYNTFTEDKINRISPIVSNYVAVNKSLLKEFNPEAKLKLGDTIFVKSIQTQEFNKCPYWGIKIIKDIMKQDSQNYVEFCVGLNDIKGNWDSMIIIKLNR